MQRHMHTRAQTALFWMNLNDVSSRTVFRYTFKNKNSATQIMDKILLKTVSDWEFQWIMKIYDNCLNRNFTQIRKHFRQIYKRKNKTKFLTKL